MAHPFEKMFDKALEESTPEDNRVILEVKKLLEKGYPAKEIGQVLKKFHNSLIQDDEFVIVEEAIEEFEQYLDD